MRCPHCAAELPEGVPVCASCGKLVEPDSRIVRLDFNGTGLQLAGWIVLLLVSAVLIVPAAWVIAAACRWFCRNLQFSDSTDAKFLGKGEQILGWLVLWVVAACALRYVRIDIDIAHGGLLLGLMRGLCVAAITAALTIAVLRWVARNIRLSSGPSLVFAGEFHGLFGWYMLYYVSLLTVIGWAWVLAGIYRWIARETKGDHIAFEFPGEGHQILWRALMAALASLPIVTIPWAWLWYKRWIVRNVTATRALS